MTRSLQTSLFFSGAIILSVVTLNVLSSPGYPWCIYPIFGILWWPLSVYFAGRRQPLHYAVGGTALLWALFLLTYLVSSFGVHPWFLYPMLAVGWWPLSVWGAKAGARRFSVTATLYILLTLLVINLLTSPGTLWCIYPALFVVWWPVSMHLHFLNRKEGEQK
jgi:hypothetical protein